MPILFTFVQSFVNLEASRGLLPNLKKAEKESCIQKLIRTEFCLIIIILCVAFALSISTENKHYRDVPRAKNVRTSAPNFGVTRSRG